MLTAERPTSAAARELAAKAELEAMLARVLGPQWRDPWWRLRNLYWIVDETGHKVRFVPNEEQEDFFTNLWFRNIILKARQLGFSTLMALMELDQALFNANYKGNIISDTIGKAGELFAKVEFAYDNLPLELRQALPIRSRTGKSSIEFDHHLGGQPATSSVTVSVSSRGGTLQMLHVSELGSISRKFPKRAAEIVSGAFPSAEAGVIVVESTAEGAAGEFWDLCEPAMKRQLEGVPETRLDYRLHFFAWFEKAAYTLSDEDTQHVVITDKLNRYFRDLIAKLRTMPRYGSNFDLTKGQRAWYAKTLEIQKKKMKREYPSTPEEAFEAAIDGAIYGDEMTAVREHGRITRIPLDATYPVNTFWDLGSANTFIWLHQKVGFENRFVKTFGGRKQPGKGIGRWWREIEAWRLEQPVPFLWGKHYMPHDADTQVQGDENRTRKQLFEDAGGRNVEVVSKIPNLDAGIELVRRVLDVNCWFDRHECAEGIAALDGYQTRWDENMGRWTDEPLHNWASHPCDAIRQFAQAHASGIVDLADLTPSLTKLKGRVRRSV